MFYIKINDNLYPATVNGKLVDRDWDNRDSKAITLEMDHATAANIFVDELDWSIVCQGDSYENEDGETITPEPVTYDNSEYCVAGSITDNRDGTVTVKMGKPTDAELLAIMMGGN